MISLRFLVRWSLLVCLASAWQLSSSNMVRANLLLQSSQPTATVVVTGLNVRSGPGTNYSRIGGVKQGDELVILDQVNDCTWLRVLTPTNLEGWVSGLPQYVTMTVACAEIFPLSTALSSTTSSEISPTSIPAATPTMTSTSTRQPATATLRLDVLAYVRSIAEARLSDREPTLTPVETPQSAMPTSSLALTPTPLPAAMAEEEAWMQMKCMDAESLQQFLTAFPTGEFVQDVKLFLTLLKEVAALQSGDTKPGFAIPFAALGARWQEWQQRRPETGAIGYVLKGGTFALSTKFPGCNVMSFDGYGAPITPTGHGSIVAFETNGSKLEYLNSIFITSDRGSTLYFAVIKDIGLVHIQGQGKVIMPDGSEIELPSSSTTGLNTPQPTTTPTRRLTATRTPIPTATPTPAPAPADLSDPLRVTVQVENGRLVLGKGKMVMGAGVFAFDPEQKLSGAPGGMMMVMEDAPPIVMMSMSSNAAGSAYTDYANVLLDLRSLVTQNYQQPINIATQYTTDGVEQCSIKLNIAGLSEIYVSNEYIVFPEHTRQLAANGPFVQAIFQSAPAIEGTLIVERNNKEIGRTALSNGEQIEFSFEKTNSENDFIVWRVETASGKTTHQGLFGFPMSSASPGLVEYRIGIGVDANTLAD